VGKMIGFYDVVRLKTY